MIASKRASSSAYDVSMRQCTSGIVERTSRHTSTPLPSGSRTSSTATSGRAAGMRCSASAVEPASPTTSMSRSRPISSARPRRTISWSSMRNTRMMPVRTGLPLMAPLCTTGPGTDVRREMLDPHTGSGDRMAPWSRDERASAQAVQLLTPEGERVRHPDFDIVALRRRTARPLPRHGAGAATRHRGDRAAAPGRAGPVGVVPRPGGRPGRLGRGRCVRTTSRSRPTATTG